MRTHDNGKTWTKITNGLPDGHFVAVVRADPIRKGLLYAGTDVGVYVSFDDGDAWQPLQRNLPVAWVRDLLVHGNDLIAATQGRAIWVLDDVSPLREINASIAHADAHLFAPAPAIRVRGSQNKDTPPPADTALGTNPPTGAIIDYTLGKSAKRVVIEIRATGAGADGKPRVVRRFASDDKTPPIKAERYFAEAWTKPVAKPSPEPGAHRFVWNLRWRGQRIIRNRVEKYGIQCDLKFGHMQAAWQPSHIPELESIYKMAVTRGMGDEVDINAPRSLSPEANQAVTTGSGGLY